jgi:hypothetical protein
MHRRSCQTSCKMAMLPSPRSPQPVTRPVWAPSYLAIAAVVAQLAHRFDHMIEAPDMRFAEQAAMGVERIAPAKLDLAVPCDEIIDCPPGSQ